jgi:hypothetical protein
MIVHHAHNCVYDIFCVLHILYKIIDSLVVLVLDQSTGSQGGTLTILDVSACNRHATEDGAWRSRCAAVCVREDLLHAKAMGKGIVVVSLPTGERIRY